MHVFLIVLPDGITLIDAGFPGTMALIETALRALGRRPEDIHDILVTHCHPDHAGGLGRDRAGDRGQGVDARRGRRDGARGQGLPALQACPGTAELVVRQPSGEAGTQRVRARRRWTTRCSQARRIPVAGGIKAIWTPGHSAGHLVFLWPGDGGVLFTGDAANNARG